jgi:integrase
MVGGVRRVLYGRTRREVVEKLDALKRQAQEAGRLPEAGKMTVAEYLAHWLQHAEGRLRPKTYYDYEILCRRHIIPHIGSLRLNKLSPLHIAKLYATLSKGLSQRRVGQVHTVLHKALGDASRWGLIASNPANLVEAPKRPHVERSLWTVEQVNIFLQAIMAGQGGRYGTLLGFLLASGCRIGEALGLRWSDVDLGVGTVRIERQVTELRSKPLEGPPKTNASIRTITLPSWGLELLRRRWIEALAEGQAGRVFCTERGTVPLQGNIRRALIALCERLSLPQARVHDLRHVHLSLLAMSGVPLKVAQARAGHSTSRMTLDVYQHVLGDGDKAAAAALDGVLRW